MVSSCFRSRPVFINYDLLPYGCLVLRLGINNTQKIHNYFYYYVWLYMLLWKVSKVICSMSTRISDVIIPK